MNSFSPSKTGARFVILVLESVLLKPIKIINGQAEVISSRCIGCGNCTRVCSQHAKVFLNTTQDATNILKENGN